MEKITLNKAKCKLCNTVLESKYTHDFITCECGNLSIDGGKEYLKRSFQSMDWVELSEADWYDENGNLIGDFIISNKAHRCMSCGKDATRIDLDFQDYFCSIECLRKVTEEFFDA